MIRTLRLQNFKGIRDVEVDLERLTVFVGPNGSGKTSILQGLELLVSCRFKRRFEVLNRMIFNKGYRDQHSAKRDQYSAETEMNLCCSTGGGDVQVRIKPDHLYFASNRPINSPPEDEVLSITARASDGPSDGWESLDKLPRVVVSLGRAELFRFDPIQMAKPSSNLGVHLQPDGGGLASFLAFMALNQPDEFSVIQQELRAIIPAIQRIRFDRRQSVKRLERFDAAGNKKPEIRVETLDELIFDLRSGPAISALAASEGTLLILGLLAVLNNRNSERPNLILLDDLDRGLHPLIQREVVILLNKMLEQQPDLQIVATTHSPYLVDSLRSEEVRMTTLNDDGTVASGRLVDHPKFEQWRNEMAPGEMWSMFGEKWVSQAATQPTETL